MEDTPSRARPGQRVKLRRDMARKTKSVDDYIAARAAAVAGLLAKLRAFVHATLPGTTETMQYGVPTFANARGEPVIYLYGAKAHVNVGFLHSAALDDPHGVLRGSGKPSKHVELAAGQPFDEGVLKRLVLQCEDIGKSG